MNISSVIKEVNSGIIVKDEFYSYIYMVAYADKEINLAKKKFLTKLCDDLEIENQVDIESRVQQYLN